MIHSMSQLRLVARRTFKKTEPLRPAGPWPDGAIGWSGACGPGTTDEGQGRSPGLRRVRAIRRSATARTAASGWCPKTANSTHRS